MQDLPTIAEALVWAFTEFTKKAIPDPRIEAEFIMMHVLGFKRHELFMQAKNPMPPSAFERLKEVVKRRLRREPSQYILGEADFRGLAFKVTEAVLIPRPETELLVTEAIKAARGIERPVILDICTGSGCIAVCAARDIPGSMVYAADISPAALRIARANSRLHGTAGSISFFSGDLFNPLPEDLKGKADIVISNPPYIPELEHATLEPEVRDFEPRQALVGGRDGLDFIKRIIAEAPAYLSPGRWLIMEIGFGQGERVREAAVKDGRYASVEILKDYSGIGRILLARLKE